MRPIRISLSREDALYMLDALNTERFRLQDRAAECFLKRENGDQWHYGLSVLEHLIQYVDQELDHEFADQELNEEALEAMADYFSTGKKA